jgi:SWI/SNF-related matrix-associated actin-dependent regulator 1 of chromatin subfamily A
MGQLKFKNNTYWWKGTFEERELVKEYGFLWDEDKKLWYTKNPKRAWLFFNDLGVHATIDGDTIQQLRSQRDSYRYSSVTEFMPRKAEYKSPRNLAYLQFQKAGICETIFRPDILLADDMGLGKTIQAIGAISNLEGVNKILIVCPATVKLHWKNKLLEWCTKYYDIHVAKGQTDEEVLKGNYDILIMNYALTPHYKDLLQAAEWDLKIIDETQYLINEEAKRTQILLDTEAKRNIFLSGTPGEKPVELWPVLNHLDPERWDNFWDFASRYCQPYTDVDGRWKYDGAENLNELQDILRSTIMVRRTKKQVLPQLGDKQRVVIPFDSEGFEYVLDYERAALRKSHGDYDRAVDILSSSLVVDGPYATVRREAGMKKVPLIVQYLKDVMLKKDKIVCYAYHRTVISKIQECFGKSCITVKGGMNAAKKAAALEKFKSDPNCKLYIGQIKAMGTGTDGLQEVTNVGIFAELDWSYKNMAQAEDRLHRYGQKDISMYHYLVVDGSLEAYMAKKLQKKKDNCNKMFDREENK